MPESEDKFPPLFETVILELRFMFFSCNVAIERPLSMVVSGNLTISICGSFCTPKGCQLKNEKILLW